MKELTVRDFRVGESVQCNCSTVCISQITETSIQVYYEGFMDVKRRYYEWIDIAENSILKVLRRIEDMTEDECVSEDMIRAIGDELISLAVSTNDGQKIRGEQVKQIASIVDYRDRIGIDQRGYIDAGLAVDLNELNAKEVE